MKFKNAFDPFNQKGVIIDDTIGDFAYDFDDESGEVVFKEVGRRSVRPDIQSFEKSCDMDFIKAQLLKEDKKGGFHEGDENLEYDEAPEDITEILQASEMAENIKSANDYLTGFKAQKEVKKDEKEVDGNVTENDDKAE